MINTLLHFHWGDLVFQRLVFVMEVIPNWDFNMLMPQNTFSFDPTKIKAL